MTLFRRIAGLILVLGLTLALAACGGLKPGDVRAFQPLKGATVAKLKSMGTSAGEGMLIRIFKQSNELEVWKRVAGGSYKLFDTYEICAWSGELGPKVKEGDRQAPEGFYNITPGLMNPKSNFYLAFNTGFPNKYDRAYGRTGSNLMVHGDCSSRGCYSMTDEFIAEIYALARESFAGGNTIIQLQIFPFRMTPQNLAKASSNQHMAFWEDIKEGYDRFELTRRPPEWDVCNREYVFDVPRAGGEVLNATAACPAGVGDASMTAALQAKQAADKAAMDTEVAALEKKALAEKAAAEKAAIEAAALRERGDAIGNFVGGIFGGKDADVKKVIDPRIKAPIPARRRG